MEKKRVLFVGDHPLAMTGNGNMMAAVLSQVDVSRFQIGCFTSGISGIVPKTMIPFPFVLYDWTGHDWNRVDDALVQIIETIDLDILVMVGTDIWSHARKFQQIDAVRKSKGFKWVSIFPYDLQELRNDWIYLIKFIDTPAVYSQYGFEMLKDHIPKIRYFRPPLYNSDLFSKLDDKVRAEQRYKLFETVSDNEVIFGFVGQNQIRKDIPRLIRAFVEAFKQVKNIRLYLHTDLEGKLHLTQMARDYKATTGMLISKERGRRYSGQHMANVYNSIDCLVNCTMQEGLSWTPLEAMLCGTPVIVSDSTAHPELVGDAGRLVPVSELSYVPILTEFKFSLGEGFDFEESFDVLIKPLLENGLLTNQNRSFLITNNGRKHITKLTKNLRYLQ